MVNEPPFAGSEVCPGARARAVADRLRSLPESRWLRVEEGATLVERGLAIAQLLADLAAGVEGRDGPEPASRPVPDLGPFAVPDQITVTATDVTTAVAGLDPDALVWSPGGARVTLRAALEVAAERIAELSALVPNAMTPPP